MGITLTVRTLVYIKRGCAALLPRPPPAVDSTSRHGSVHGFCEEASEGQGKSRENLRRLAFGGRPRSRLWRVPLVFLKANRLLHKKSTTDRAGIPVFAWLSAKNNSSTRH